MPNVIDPVCGKEIETGHAGCLFSDYNPGQECTHRPEPTNGNGKRYYFCSAACKAKFDDAPGFYGNLGGGPGLYNQPEPDWS